MKYTVDFLFDLKYFLVFIYCLVEGIMNTGLVSVVECGQWSEVKETLYIVLPAAAFYLNTSPLYT